MNCQNCGKKMPDDSLFCPECGVKQETELHEVDNTSVNGLMKSCIKCGFQIPADSRFCPECRTRQEEASPVTKMQPIIQNGAKAQRQSPASVVSSPEEAERIRKRNKIIGIVMGAAVGLCLVIGILSVFIKPTVKLNNYLTVTFEGYDTVGKAVVKFDTEKFVNDYEGNLTGYVGGSIDKESGLSNGDVVTYIWNCDDEYVLETYGYKLKYEDVEITVENLKEAESFDPFEGIEVVFSGISPNGTASIAGGAESPAARNLRYDLDVYNGLSNGDEVTITASIYYDDPVEYCIENYGLIPSPITRTYTVGGLDSYIRSITDVSADSLQEMQKQAEDVYKASAAQKWGDGESLRSFTYIGSYLLTSKSSDDYWGNYTNMLYMVYKAEVNDKYSNDGDIYDETNDIYWYICYYNLLVNPEGVTTVDITNYRTPNDRFTIDSGISFGWRSTKTWDYYGYQTLDDLYRVVVTSNLESYNHEDNVDESVAVTEVEEDREEIGGEEGIIFPDSSEELIDRAAVEKLSDEELRYAINELYARNGYIFNDDGLRTYYEKYDWYVPTVRSDDFSIDLFNDIEKENIKVMQEERDHR